MDNKTTFQEEAKEQSQARFENQMGLDLIERAGMERKSMPKQTDDFHWNAQSYTLTGDKKYDQYAIDHCAHFGFFPKAKPTGEPELEPIDFDGNPIDEKFEDENFNGEPTYGQLEEANANALALDAERMTGKTQLDPHLEAKMNMHREGYLADELFNRLSGAVDAALYGTSPHIKETNPKDAVGIKKVAFSTVPMEVIAEMGLGMMEGARKYGRHNYRDAGVRASVYFDGTLRHLIEWWEGTNTDPDSGLNHITKALTSLAVLRDCMIRNNWTDDRPPKLDDNWMKQLNEIAAKIVEKYPNPVPAHTHKFNSKRSHE